MKIITKQIIEKCYPCLQFLEYTKNNTNKHIINNDTYAISKKRTMFERYHFCLQGLKLLMKDSTICKLFILGLIEYTIIFLLVLFQSLPGTTPFTIFLFPITIEFLNTSIETAVDHTSTKKSFLAAKAKDIAATASLIIHLGVTAYWHQLLFVSAYKETESLLFSTLFVISIWSIFYPTFHCIVNM